MKFRLFILSQVIAAVFCVCVVPFAEGSTLTISPAGNGVFHVQALGMTGAAAMDIVINYDAATLSNPRVQQGPLLSGAMVAANPNIPGIVRIAAIRSTPIIGSGALLTVTFDQKGGSQGVITGLSLRLADINGSLLLSSTRIQNAAETPSGNGASEQQSGGTTPSAPPAAGGAPIVVIAGSTATKDEEAARKQDEEQPAALPADSPEPLPEAAEKSGQEAARPDVPDTAPEPAAKTVYAQKSILDLFRDYSGVRTAGALLSLFDQGPMIGFQQEPRVALSDGSSTVSVSFITMTSAKEPVLSLKGLRKLSLRKDKENTNTWILKARAEKGTVKAAITIPQTAVTMEIPVTLAPKVELDMDGSGKVTEDDFAFYLKGPAGKKGLGFDLNSDGSADYLDDYIFAANYLARKDRSPAKKKAGK